MQELAEYCRRKGLYPEQIQRWREAAAGGNDDTQRLSAAERRELQAERKKTRRQEKELRRKDKALAEAAALLVLQKKAQAIWGDDGERRVRTCACCCGRSQLFCASMHRRCWRGFDRSAGPG